MGIVVLGVHRSGSSVLARLLSLMGADLGPEEALMPGAKGNPRGHFEHLPLVRLHDEALGALGGTWCRLAGMLHPGWQHRLPTEFRSRVGAILEPFDGLRTWVLKDPRSCLFFEFWRDLVRDPVVVYLRRSPMAVARSLAARNGFPLAFGLALWEFYNLRALRGCAGMPVVGIEFDDLLADPVAACARLLERLAALGITGLKKPEPGAIEAFVDRTGRLSGPPGEREDFRAWPEVEELAVDLAAGSSPAAIRDRPVSALTHDLLVALDLLLDGRLPVDHGDGRTVYAGSRILDGPVTAPLTEADPARRELKAARHQAQRSQDEVRAMKEQVLVAKARAAEASELARAAKAQAQACESRILAQQRAAAAKDLEVRGLEKLIVELSREIGRRNPGPVGSLAAWIRAQGGPRLADAILAVRKGFRRAPETAPLPAGLGGGHSGDSTDPLLDPAFYLASNPDLALAGVDPVRHWHERGKAEGRRPRRKASRETEPQVPSEATGGAPPRASGGAPQPPPTPPASPARVVADRALRNLARMRLEAHLETGSRLVFASSPAPEVSIVIPVWNQAALTLACLASLGGGTKRSFEVLVFDNGSTDETPRLLASIGGLRRLRSEENLGFGQAINRAAEVALGMTLVFLNNDLVCLPGNLDALLDTLASTPGAGAVGGRLVFPDGQLQEAGSVVWRDGSTRGYGRNQDPADGAYGFRRAVDYCSAAFVATPRRTFLDLGGFDPRYHLAYYEDVDYCFRLREHGLETYLEPRATAIHHESASSTSTAVKELILRNRAVFVQRHAATLADHPSPTENIRAYRSRPRPGPRLLFLEDKIPHSRLGQGLPRSKALIEALAERCRETTLIAGTILPEEAGQSPRSLLDPSIEWMERIDRTKFAGFLKDRRGFYDLVVVCRPHNLKSLLQTSQGLFDGPKRPRLVYDAEAVFASRSILQAEVLGNPLPPEQCATLVADELALARHADAILAVNGAEADRFAAASGRPVGVFHHLVVPVPDPKGFDGRDGLLFLGPLFDPGTPNADSMIWFVDRVMPRLRTLMGASAPRLRIVGPCTEECSRRLAGEGIDLLGPIDDVSTVFEENRLFVAPTRFAAGIPLKLLEAAARGLPTVATELLAGQLGWKAGFELLDSPPAHPERFAEAIVRGYADRPAWERTQGHAAAWIRAHCGREQLERAVDLVLGPWADR